MCYRGGFHKRVIKLTLAHPRNSPPVLSVHQQVSPMHSLFGSTGSLGHLSFKNFSTLLNLSLIQKPTAVNSCLFCPRSSSRLLVFSIHTLLRSPFTLRLSPFTLRLSNRSAFSTIDRIVHRTDSCAEYFAAEKKSSGRNICFFQKCKRQGAFFDHLGPAFSFNHPGPALSDKWAMIYLILGCPPISPCMVLQGGAEGGGGVIYIMNLGSFGIAWYSTVL